MAKPKDLTPKFKIPTAERELELQLGQVPMAQQQGGLSLFSNKFKRGYGDAVFGSDENGIWLGQAEFDGAPFSVDMNGNLVASSATLGGYSKINVFKQAGIPNSLAVGDLWFDTDDDNKVYRAAAVGADEITAGEWEAVDDQRAADALLKAGSSQTLTGDFNLNDGNVKIDGANKRIIINDGSNNRVLIGYGSGLF